MTAPLLAVGRRVRQRHVLRALDRVGMPASVLDAGCGDGRLLAKLAGRWPDATLLGVDPDADALEQARARLEPTERVLLRVGSIGDPNPGGEQFDLVVCVDVLEHVRDDRAAIGWLGSRVARDGHLVVHVPASPQLHLLPSINDALGKEIAHGRGPHLREGYEPARLGSLAQEAGLVIESIGWTFHRFATRLAEDVDTWLYQHRLKPVKALALPFLLLAAEVERCPATTPPGYGVLMTARRLAR